MTDVRRMLLLAAVAALTTPVAHANDSGLQPLRVDCPVTVVRPPVPDPKLPGFNYGNASIRVALFPRNGRLIAGRLASGGSRATINDDGSIGAKYGWWRTGSGKIRISGRRLDAPAPPLRAHIPDGYSSGFQPAGITFPTIGCWRVVGKYGSASLAFTVLVTKSRLGP